jgi:hypothetical protein
MSYLDPYQIEHAKNFRYRYYPPKLVELAPPEQAEQHAKSEGSLGMSGDYGGHHTEPSSWNGKLIWIIIITLILLSCFLIIGVLMMSGPQQSGGGSRR